LSERASTAIALKQPDALELAVAAVRRHPSWAEGWWILAFAPRDPTIGIELLELPIRYADGLLKADALGWRATRHPVRGQEGAAHDDARAALAIDPDLPGALSVEGHVFVRGGDFEQARVAYERIAALYPGTRYGELAERALRELKELR